MMAPRRLPWPVALLLLAGAVAARAGDILIESAASSVRNDILLIDAVARLELGADPVDAVDSGIPLVIELDFRLSAPRRLLWDEEVVAVRREYVIERHALTKQYTVTNRTTGEHRGHANLEDALDDLGHVHDLAVIEAAALDADTDYEAALRLRLDLEALPAPMIPIAYVSPSWRMSSGWHRWRLTR